METTRLFYVLVPTYRVIRGVPVVHLYGTTDRGESALAVDDRPRPCFFVPAVHADAAGEIADPLRIDPLTGLLDLLDRPVARLSFREPALVPPAREALAAAGIPCLEADVRYAYRYMIDAGIRGAAEVSGEAEPGRHTALVFRRPTFRPARFKPALRVLSIDLETDPKGQRLYSAALAGSGIEDVLIVSERPVAGAEAVPDERALLAALEAKIRAADPDVLTGWNVVGFDLRVLDRRAKELSVPLRLGRGDDALRFDDDQGFARQERAYLPGRQVLDGIAAVRDTGLAVEDFRLETVAAEVLGRTKLATGAGRAQKIARAYEADPEWLVRYNLEDARLVLEVLGKTNALDLALERSVLTGMPLDRVGASVATFDFLYLGELHKRGRVAPSGGEREVLGEVVGGTVLDSRAGLFPWVAVFDFRSLYPSIIRTFGIDPYAFAGTGDPAPQFVRSPNGALFRRGEGILPEILEELFDRRERARADGDHALVTAVKILMNSFYGVLGTPTCRFAEAAVANAITSFGGEILRRTKELVEAMGFPVLYGDTDSLFVRTGAADEAGARAAAERIRGKVEEELGRWTVSAHSVASRLTLSLQWVFRRLFLPALRGATEGSKKRYAGIVDRDGKTELVVVGLEAVRRDWPAAGREFQRNLLRLVLEGRDPEAYIRETVRRLRAGELDAGLVYRKVLRKSPEEYGKALPPHVRAAMLEGRERGGAVRYVVAREGPVPVAAGGPLPKGIDYAHYVRKVIAPLADAILPFLGRTFAEVGGGDNQLRLF